MSPAAAKKNNFVSLQRFGPLFLFTCLSCRLCRNFKRQIRKHNLEDEYVEGEFEKLMRRSHDTIISTLRIHFELHRFIWTDEDMLKVEKEVRGRVKALRGISEDAQHQAVERSSTPHTQTLACNTNAKAPASSRSSSTSAARTRADVEGLLFETRECVTVLASDDEVAHTRHPSWAGPEGVSQAVWHLSQLVINHGYEDVADIFASPQYECYTVARAQSTMNKIIGLVIPQPDEWVESLWGMLMDEGLEHVERIQVGCTRLRAIEACQESLSRQ